MDNLSRAIIVLARLFGSLEYTADGTTPWGTWTRKTFPDEH